MVHDLFSQAVQVDQLLSPSCKLSFCSVHFAGSAGKMISRWSRESVCFWWLQASSTQLRVWVSVCLCVYRPTHAIAKQLLQHRPGYFLSMTLHCCLSGNLPLQSQVLKPLGHSTGSQLTHNNFFSSLKLNGHQGGGGLFWKCFDCYACRSRIKTSELKLNSPSMNNIVGYF